MTVSPTPNTAPSPSMASKKRYLFEPGEGGWSVLRPSRGPCSPRRSSGSIPPCSPSIVWKAMGIEVVPAEVRRAEREAASARAVQEARRRRDRDPDPARGREALGCFPSRTRTAASLRSAELKGKVVLIDCWAAWSGPCTEKLPRLKALYDRRRGEGFEVIGLNFDDDPRAGGASGPSDGLALAAGLRARGDRTRRLWNEDSNLPNFPRSLLIDRQGILRWDGGPDDLEARVESLLK